MVVACKVLFHNWSLSCFVQEQVFEVRCCTSKRPWQKALDTVLKEPISILRNTLEIDAAFKGSGQSQAKLFPTISSLLTLSQSTWLLAPATYLDRGNKQSNQIPSQNQIPVQ